MEVVRFDRSAQAALAQGVTQCFGGFIKLRLQLPHACAGIGWILGSARQGGTKVRRVGMSLEMAQKKNPL